MAVYMSWLADAARMTGYPVSEVSNWRGRGHGGMAVVEGVVCHHTADGPRGDYPSLGVVTNGRAGLAGPLCNYGLGRSGTIYVIAAGASYHAGASSWAGYSNLNNKFVGIEAESVGIRDDWTPEQRDCYPRLCAAICHYIRRNASRVAGHKEVCVPRGRKIDPAYWDMNQVRGNVAYMLADPANRIPRGSSDVEMITDQDLRNIAETVKWNLVDFRPAENSNLWDRDVQQDEAMERIEAQLAKIVELLTPKAPAPPAA